MSSRLHDPMVLSIESIKHAYTVINRTFMHTPCFLSETMSRDLGCTILLKVEVVNPIRCFKGRGADYYMKGSGAGPFVCASAGNFAQALAFAARDCGAHVVAFTPKQATASKLEHLKDLGAEVRAIGFDYDDAKSKAKEYATASESCFVEDGSEPAISEGAGTIGIELTESGLAFDTVVVPLGGGALIAGVARWMKYAAPNVKVVGVVPSGAPSMEISWRGQRVVCCRTANTIAEGLAIRRPIESVISEIVTTVDEVLLFDDTYLTAAMQLIRDRASLTVEPSGATAIATIMQYPDRFRCRRVVTLITGANI